MERSKGDKEKEKILFHELVQLERAAQLKVIDAFEYDLVQNMRFRFLRFGMNMVITDKQREELKKLNNRWMAVHSRDYMHDL